MLKQELQKNQKQMKPDNQDKENSYFKYDAFGETDEPTRSLDLLLKTSFMVKQKRKQKRERQGEMSVNSYPRDSARISNSPANLTAFESETETYHNVLDEITSMFTGITLKDEGTDRNTFKSTIDTGNGSIQEITTKETKNTFQCHVCGNYFKSKAKLSSHVESINDFQCNSQSCNLPCLKYHIGELINL